MGATEGHAEVTAVGFLRLLVFSVPTERVAITAGDDLRGLGTCHQQAFWQEYRKRIPTKIRNLTEDCIACHFVATGKSPHTMNSIDSLNERRYNKDAASNI